MKKKMIAMFMAACMAAGLATNNFGAGDYALDMHEANVKAGCDAVGATLNVVNNEFTVDNVITQFQNQIASNVDAACLVGVSDTVFTNAAQICEEAKVPFVFYANTVNEKDLEVMKGYEYFVGEIVQNPAEEGEIIAQIASTTAAKQRY